MAKWVLTDSNRIEFQVFQGVLVKEVYPLLTFESRLPRIEKSAKSYHLELVGIYNGGL